MKITRQMLFPLAF